MEGMKGRMEERMEEEMEGGLKGGMEKRVEGEGHILRCPSKQKPVCQSWHGRAER